MKISVILTAFNAAAYLRETLDSIVAQEHKDWEAICIDDGSTDGSGVILDEYAARDERIKVVHHENRGAAACRNEGVSLSTGGYIAFCDADDAISPYWFSNAAALIAECAPDLLRAHLVFAKNPPADFSVFRKVGVEEEISGRRDCLRWAWRELFGGGFTALNFIKADLKPYIRFPEQLLVKEDSTMLVNLAPHLSKIIQSDYCGYFYRDTRGSLLRRKRPSRASVLYLQALAEIWQSQRSLESDIGLKEVLKGAIQKFADNDVIDWAIDSADEPREAKRQVRQAWMALRDAGAFDGRYHNRAMFYLPFQWWKATGNESLIKQTWKLFLFVRKMLLRK